MPRRPIRVVRSGMIGKAVPEPESHWAGAVAQAVNDAVVAVLIHSAINRAQPAVFEAGNLRLHGCFWVCTLYWGRSSVTVALSRSLNPMRLKLFFASDKCLAGPSHALHGGRLIRCRAL